MFCQSRVISVTFCYTADKLEVREKQCKSEVARCQLKVRENEKLEIMAPLY